MSDAPGWICPACQRHVPGRIERCRCGHDRMDGDVSAESAERIASPPRRTRAFIEVAILAVVIVASGYYYTTARSSSEHGQSASSADARVDRHDPVKSRTIVPTSSNRSPDPDSPVVAPANDLPESSAPPLEDVIERAMPAVVLIESEKTRGSGFLVRTDLAVTNAHVVAGAESVTVATKNGHEVTGTVIRSSTDLDLALVSIPPIATADVPLPLGDSSSLRLGQGVVRLGWAEDLHQSTVTRGIVTGLRHDGKQRLVQTDAVPNHGDSGGPVLDRRGEVIGVTTFRADISGKTSGFAVAVDDVKALIASAGR